jgi:predicted kinase
MQTPNILKILHSSDPTVKASFIAQQIASGAFPNYAMICSEAVEIQESSIIEHRYKDINVTGLCFRRAVRLVSNGAPFVVINIENSSVEDLAPYVKLAEAYGYDCEILRLTFSAYKDFGYPDTWKYSIITVD